MVDGRQVIETGQDLHAHARYHPAGGFRDRQAQRVVRADDRQHGDRHAPQLGLRDR